MKVNVVKEAAKIIEVFENPKIPSHPDDIQQQLPENLSVNAEVTSPINTAPLYSTRVSSQEQADKLISSPMYQAFIKETTRIAELMGLKVEGYENGIGGFFRKARSYLCSKCYRQL